MRPPPRLASRSSRDASVGGRRGRQFKLDGDLNDVAGLNRGVLRRGKPHLSIASLPEDRHLYGAPPRRLCLRPYIARERQLLAHRFHLSPEPVEGGDSGLQFLRKFGLTFIGSL